MSCHAIFKESDVFPDKNTPEEGVVFEDRPTGKAIVYDADGNIALVGNEVNDFYLLPGGGIDPNESIEIGIIRECLEEIGCEVQLVSDLGTTEDYRTRDQKHCINYCKTAKVIGEKGKLQLTEEEEKNDMHVKWVSLEEAIGILSDEVEMVKRGKVEFYNTGFNILRDHIFLLEAAKLEKND
jgi:8-oxo-dGTP diphosphatase